MSNLYFNPVLVSQQIWRILSFFKICKGEHNMTMHSASNSEKYDVIGKETLMAIAYFDAFHWLHRILWNWKKNMMKEYLLLTDNGQFGTESCLAKLVGQFEVVCSRILDFSSGDGQWCHVVDHINIESSVQRYWPLQVQ